MTGMAPTAWKENRMHSTPSLLQLNSLAALPGQSAKREKNERQSREGTQGQNAHHLQTI